MRLQNTLKGFRFEDNKSKYRWEDGKNGMAQLNFDFFLPTRVAEVGRLSVNQKNALNSFVSCIFTNSRQKMFFLRICKFMEHCF